MDLLLWAKLHKKALKWVATLCMSLLVMIAWSYQTVYQGNFVSSRAEQLFDTWSSSGSGDESEAAFKKLSHFLKRNSFLQKSYDEKVAQILIAKGEVEKARPFVKRLLKRFKDPFCKQFSLATMQISSGKMEQALTLSKTLNKELKKAIEVAEGPKKALYHHLYYFNLYRISCLLERLNRPMHLEKALIELKSQLFDEDGNALDEGKSFLDVFCRQGFSFQDYLDKKKPYQCSSVKAS